MATSAATQALDASVTERPAITDDFSFTSRHIRSRATPTLVQNADCCVCHMEGTTSTGKINSTYHGNSYVELRDPDLGSTIKAKTHSGSNSAEGSWSDAAGDAVFVRFKRSLGTRFEADTATIPGKTVTNFQVLGGIQVNFCLKCHDAGGAAAADGSSVIPGGTAGKPFNGTVSANPSGNVLDVAAQFANTNRSFHPVLHKSNNGYTNTSGTRMSAPWNSANGGATKTGTTSVYGSLMTCWDCHAPNNISSSATLTVSGIHGGAVNGTDGVPLRGNVYINSATTTNATNLCTNCHVVSGGTTNHGAGSAITTSTNGSMTYFQNRCFYCHAGVSGTTRAARPIGAGDAHGYSTRSTGGAFPAASNGYAFIRSERWYASTTQHIIRSIGATTYSQSCGQPTGCSDTMGPYSPGGVY